MYIRQNLGTEDDDEVTGGWRRMSGSAGTKMTRWKKTKSGAPARKGHAEASEDRSLTLSSRTSVKCPREQEKMRKMMMTID